MTTAARSRPNAARPRRTAQGRRQGERRQAAGPRRKALLFGPMNSWIERRLGGRERSVLRPQVSRFAEGTLKPNKRLWTAVIMACARHILARPRTDRPEAPDRLPEGRGRNDYADFVIGMRR